MKICVNGLARMSPSFGAASFILRRYHMRVERRLVGPALEGEEAARLALHFQQRVGFAAGLLARGLDEGHQQLAQRIGLLGFGDDLGDDIQQPAFGSLRRDCGDKGRQSRSLNERAAIKQRHDVSPVLFSRGKPPHRKRFMLARPGQMTKTYGNEAMPAKTAKLDIKPAVDPDNPCQPCGACCGYSRNWPRFTIEDDAALGLIPETLVNERLSGMRCDGRAFAAR